GTAQVLFKGPFAATARLAGGDEVEARHERNELPPGAGLFPRICRNALAAATAFRPMPRWQFPTVGEYLWVQLPPQLRSFHVAGRLGRPVHEPLGDDLPVLPAPLVQHAIGNARQ